MNGKRIGDAVLSPAATNHRKRARYVTYEIADQLQEGKNVIALWLGVSWSIFPPYKTPDKPQTPIVLAQADIWLPGGGSVRVVTDESWRTHASPNTLLGVWDFMHFGGERYDAGKEVPGWSEASFDDSAWKPATVYTPSLMLSAADGRAEPADQGDSTGGGRGAQARRVPGRSGRQRHRLARSGRPRQAGRPDRVQVLRAARERHDATACTASTSSARPRRGPSRTGSTTSPAAGSRSKGLKYKPALDEMSRASSCGPTTHGRRTSSAPTIC